MGYRSDVAYKIWFDTVENRDSFIDMVLAHPDASLSEALKECEIGEEPDALYGGTTPVISYHGENHKWYENFADVRMHVDLLRFANAAFGDESCGARFVRMGENDDDIVYEEYGNSDLIDYDDLYVQRTLIRGEVENTLTLDEWREKQPQKTAKAA